VELDVDLASASTSMPDVLGHESSSEDG